MPAPRSGFSSSSNNTLDPLAYLEGTYCSLVLEKIRYDPQVEKQTLSTLKCNVGNGPPWEEQWSFLGSLRLSGDKKGNGTLNSVLVWKKVSIKRMSSLNPSLLLHAELSCSQIRSDVPQSCFELPQNRDRNIAAKAMAESVTQDLLCTQWLGPCYEKLPQRATFNRFDPVELALND